MKIYRIISAPIDPDAINDRAIAYFQSAGFHPVSSHPDLVFKRGSGLDSLVPFFPEDWPIVAAVRIHPAGDENQEISLSFDIQTPGILAPEKQWSNWVEEIECLAQTIRTGCLSPFRAAPLRSSLAEILLAVAGMVILAIMFGMTTHFHL